MFADTSGTPLAELESAGVVSGGTVTISTASGQEDIADTYQFYIRITAAGGTREWITSSTGSAFELI